MDQTLVKHTRRGSAGLCVRGNKPNHTGIGGRAERQEHEEGWLIRNLPPMLL